MVQQDFDKKSDSEIVKRARDDAQFFGVLMERYEKRLLRYIHRLLCVTHEDAEDVLQESFLKAYRNLNDFDTSLSFSSWMYRIVHNVSISTWRKANVRPYGHAIDVDEYFWDRIIADDDIVRELDRDTDRKRVIQIFQSMDEKYRNVLILYYIEDKQYKELSDILKKPMGTVSTLLNRAKKQFRQQCTKENISFHQKYT